MMVAHIAKREHIWECPECLAILVVPWEKKTPEWVRREERKKRKRDQQLRWRRKRTREVRWEKDDSTWRDNGRRVKHGRRGSSCGIGNGAR